MTAVNTKGKGRAALWHGKLPCRLVEAGPEQSLIRFEHLPKYPSLSDIVCVVINEDLVYSSEGLKIRKVDTKRSKSASYLQ